ncbi:MAG: ROK family transcriptional regulator [Intrasporangium sp.]|uniref:ROK family transcriptional regulator n=1 Tax=Intrasporangium sp. TaxID=1925024 RepID=UPI003F7CDCB0
MTRARPVESAARRRVATRPAHGRQQNLSLVLQTLYAEGAMSRADLARATGLTRVTVSDLVAELLEVGTAVELGRADDVRPGKPATLVDVNRTGRQIVGLDLTAHEVLRAAVLDLDGQVLARAERPIDRSAGRVDVDLVLDLAREALALATAPVIGIGVGTPGIVVEDGLVATAPNLGWVDVPLRQALAEATGLPVHVCNDADAAVHADYTLGGGLDDVLLVKIGRGVGAGLIVGGRRVQGAHHAAGELGHVTVGTDGGATCRCGKVGCLETWLSAPNLEAALAGRSPEETPEPLRSAGERLAIAVAPVVAALDLAEVVLSGPEHLLAGPLLESVETTLQERLLTRPGSSICVRLAADSRDIVLRGAAALVLSDQLGVA